MAKSLDSPYEAGNRGASWLKIKRAHTLDLVVIAAEWGHGRRTGKLSNLHLGALDTATGEYVMLGKTFKGLTDEMLEWQTRELLARETRREGITVYVRPELVVEIAFSDLQASPRYPGGLALRLARVKRYRDDKARRAGGHDGDRATNLRVAARGVKPSNRHSGRATRSSEVVFLRSRRRPVVAVVCQVQALRAYRTRPESHFPVHWVMRIIVCRA